MKSKEIFYNPFRLISPKLDSEASRLEEIYESPPEEVTCLEEGLLIMMNKIIRMTGLIRKSLLISDAAKAEECETLAKEIHNKPTVIIARTTKGKGVSFMENDSNWHGAAPDDQQVAEAVKELKRGLM